MRCLDCVLREHNTLLVKTADMYRIKKKYQCVRCILFYYIIISLIMESLISSDTSYAAWLQDFRDCLLINHRAVVFAAKILAKAFLNGYSPLTLFFHDITMNRFLLMTYRIYIYI